eukprot:gnl/MRDRNA2_/MRDRNA2_88250_c0_seq1.p1 gnl/MRDRNA2_/MRDRNA2_88250_c0~~gnl/MRDRNA2_/MRDRNA2_88250_c0_seq1.p1  ORF type:complete len:146 (-),score=16.49 gnl/MRDRNA2_/MRDRNA2_88250_c0_seq1:588-1025(-)
MPGTCYVVRRSLAMNNHGDNHGDNHGNDVLPNLLSFIKMQKRAEVQPKQKEQKNLNDASDPCPGTSSSLNSEIKSDVGNSTCHPTLKSNSTSSPRQGDFEETSTSARTTATGYSMSRGSAKGKHKLSSSTRKHKAIGTRAYRRSS